MSYEIFNKVNNFLINSPQDHITAVSVIYQIIEDDPWITLEDSRNLVQSAVNILNVENDSVYKNKLLKIIDQVSEFLK